MNLPNAIVRRMAAENEVMREHLRRHAPDVLRYVDAIANGKHDHELQAIVSGVDVRKDDSA